MQYKVFFYPRNNDHILLANKLNMYLEQCKIYGQISAVKIVLYIELFGMFGDQLKMEEIDNALLPKKTLIPCNLVYSGIIFYIEKIDNNEQN